MSFLESLGRMVAEPNLGKTQYYILKCFTSVVNNHDAIIGPYVDYLLFNVIPGYIKVVPDDERLAKDDPLELLRK